MMPVFVVKPRPFAWRSTRARAVVAGLHAHGLLQALHGLDVVVEDVGLGVEHGVDVRPAGP